MENGADISDKPLEHSLLYQYVAVLTGVLGCVCVGMHIGWTSPSLPLLLNENSTIPTTNSDGSWIVAMPFIAQPLGCIIVALTINRIGRKTCILTTAPLFAISWLIIAYAKNVVTIECARILAGVAFGITFTALPMYIGEVADCRIRGFLGCSIKTVQNCGLLLITVIGLQCDMYVTALIALSVPVLHFIAFFWMPESPYFFILQKRNRRAAASLRKLTKTQNADREIYELTSMIEKTSRNSGHFFDIFTKKVNRRALIIILGLRTLEHVSGFYAIMSYCLMIFDEAGGSVIGDTATIIYVGIQLISTALSCILVDRTGRKVLLIISLSGSACALLVEGVYFYLKYQTTADVSSWGLVSLAALLLYSFSSSIGLATIPMLMIGEIFAADIKAFAVGIGISWFALMATVVSKLFQIAKDAFGIHVPFFIFTVCCLLGVIFIIYFVPETKGRSLEQIQLEWIGLENKSSRLDRDDTVKTDMQNMSTIL